MNIVKINNENEFRKQLIDSFVKLLDVPFQHYGSTMKGLDCSGCLYLGYGLTGITLPRTDGKLYNSDWYLFSQKERYLEILNQYFDMTDNPKPGDLVLFKTQFQIVDHIGIVEFDNNFIHAQSGKYVKRTPLNHRFWKKRIFGYMIYKGLIDKE